MYMKSLDPSTLFNLFTIEETTDEVVAGSIVDLYHPYIIMARVVKGVENFYIISQIYTQKHGEQFERVEHTLKQRYFDRLYRSLDRFNERKLEHIEHALAVGKSGMSWALTEMMDFYEEVEEYEKCARLRDLMNVFNSVNKLEV